ncbi:hypothetical protein FN846DRAFT_986688 [Sphaerosporella brunnea]|uniref:C2H2-type domain-containing protein n=1 Tax=Sphaerosporella brunnea TaxID=1250544 RepID=A0A5J5FA82_9PEZI|nr:hypothetical protein FN846DRAFT_986688 [Sphaerosporella brunnea]
MEGGTGRLELPSYMNQRASEDALFLKPPESVTIDSLPSAPLIQPRQPQPPITLLHSPSLHPPIITDNFQPSYPADHGTPGQLQLVGEPSGFDARPEFEDYLNLDQLFATQFFPYLFLGGDEAWALAASSEAGYTLNLEDDDPPFEPLGGEKNGNATLSNLPNINMLAPGPHQGLAISAGSQNVNSCNNSPLPAVPELSRTPTPAPASPGYAHPPPPAAPATRHRAHSAPSALRASVVYPSPPAPPGPLAVHISPASSRALTGPAVPPAPALLPPPVPSTIQTQPVPIAPPSGSLFTHFSPPGPLTVHTSPASSRAPTGPAVPPARALLPPPVPSAVQAQSAPIAPPSGSLFAHFSPPVSPPRSPPAPPLSPPPPPPMPPGPPPPPPRKRRRLDTAENFTCPRCGEHFTTPTNRNRHDRGTSCGRSAGLAAGGFRCGQCGRRYTRLDNLKKHERVAHAAE